MSEWVSEFGHCTESLTQNTQTEENLNEENRKCARKNNADDSDDDDNSSNSNERHWRESAKDGEKPLKLFQIKLLAQTVALVASVFYTNF